MAIAGALGPSLRNALIAISLVIWPTYARLIRGQVLALKQREFVEAAQALGVPGWRITAVAGLAFIGFGAQPPTPEWGVLISAGRNDMATRWWLASIPGLAILLLVSGFNLLGDGLRDAFDPRLRSS